MYRILHAEHHRTGNKWCIYPMYDYAHGQSDSLEKVTHSMCSLEFADHQPLYNWFIEQLGIFPSQQIEFDRLSLTYTLMSKRKLRQLVRRARVRGWDDPRMPTLSGIRRRGYTPEAIRNFVTSTGVSQTNGIDRAGDARTFRPRRSEQARAAGDGGVASAESRDRQLSGESGRGDGCGQQSGRRERWLAQGSVLARTLHRAGRLPRSASAEIFPAYAGARSAASLWILRHLQQRGEKRKRRSDRSALHLRSGNTGRQCPARRTKSESRRSTGSRRNMPSTPKCASTKICFTKENPERRGGRRRMCSTT